MKLKHLFLIAVMPFILAALLGSTAIAADIVNGDFESGNLNGWTTTGDAAIVQRGSDPFVGISKVFEGKNAAQIGDQFCSNLYYSPAPPGDNAGEPTQSSISQKFTIPTDSTSAVLNFNYAVLAEGNHSKGSASWFEISVRDVTSNSYIKTISNQAATDYGVPPGWLNSGVRDIHNNQGSDPIPNWLYYQWQPVTINLSSAKGHEVELVFKVSDCYANYHTAYGYIDNLFLGMGPVIDSLKPSEGKIGTKVKIIGKNFGATQGNGFATFSDIKASIVSWSDKLIVAYVPKKAVTGNVFVFNDKGKSNGALFTVPPEPATITGNVNDGHGNNLPGLQIELYKKKAGNLFLKARTYTDNGGTYSMKHALEKATYVVRIALKEKDGRIEVRRINTLVNADKEFDSDPDKNETPVRVDFNLTDTSEIKGSSIKANIGDIDNCGTIWYYVYKNYALAKSIGHKLNFLCPVKIFEGGNNLKGAFFSPGDKSIHMGANLVNDDAADGDPPPWDYVKNRESHEFGHALMWSFWNSFGANGNNHWGYANTNTGDSLCEGWAEFWTLYLVRNTDINSPLYEYDGWGDIVNQKRKAWAPIDTSQPTASWDGAKIPLEEFAAAGALYDVYSPNGSIKKGINGLIDAIKANAAGTMTGLFHRLGSDSASAFTECGFFKDVNGNWTFDGNEAVGAGNGKPFIYHVPSSTATILFPARPNRERRPYEENSFVKVNLSSQGGALTESEVHVQIHYTDPNYEIWDFGYDTTVTKKVGKIYVNVPSNAEAYISVKGPSGQLSRDALTLTYSQYSSGLANPSGGAVVEKTFKVVGQRVPAKPVFLSPRANAKVKGEIVIKVKCAGNPNWVQLWIDGKKKTKKNVYPFNFNLNTRSLKNGKRVLMIKSHNQAGYSSAVKRVIIVNNGK